MYISPGSFPIGMELPNFDIPITKTPTIAKNTPAYINNFPTSSTFTPKLNFF